MKMPVLGRFVCLAIAFAFAGCAAGTARPEAEGAENTVAASAASKPGGRREVVAIAEQMIGKPYRYGGSSPRGFDCSGLVQYSYTQAGYSVPRESIKQYQTSRDVKMSELQAGDLLFFRINGKISHVGIFIEKDRFIHAPSSGKKVVYGSLTNPYWRAHFVKAGRVEKR